MNHCSPPQATPSKQRPDYLLWTSASLVLLLYLGQLLLGPQASLPGWLLIMASGIYELINNMWWGLVTAVITVGLLDRIPRDLVISALGQGGSLKGVVRATCAGVLLDLCSHGILMVGTKLYERGASLGQMMAFLIASPWNSLSLTLILISLIGWGWTLSFVVLSMAIGVMSGIIFDALVRRKVLPGNPHKATHQSPTAASLPNQTGRLQPQGPWQATVGRPQTIQNGISLAAVWSAPSHRHPRHRAHGYLPNPIWSHRHRPVTHASRRHPHRSLLRGLHAHSRRYSHQSRRPGQ